MFRRCIDSVDYVVVVFPKIESKRYEWSSYARKVLVTEGQILIVHYMRELVAAIPGCYENWIFTSRDSRTDIL